MLTFILALSCIGLLVGAYGYFLYKGPKVKPSVFRFSWNGKHHEVAAARLIEWLAVRQLQKEDWPPMRDILKALDMIDRPLTETELRREVWNMLSWVKRALERGQEAMHDTARWTVEGPSNGSGLDS